MKIQDLNWIDSRNDRAMRTKTRPETEKKWEKKKTKLNVQDRERERERRKVRNLLIVCFEVVLF